MARQGRTKTDYPGVYYVMGTAVATGKPEKIFYIFYRKDGHQIEEKAGRQHQDAMTPAKAARIRAERIEGKTLSNQGRREAIQAAKEAEANRWTLSRLWDEYKSHRPDGKGLRTDDGRFHLHIAPAFGDKTTDEIITLDVTRLRSKLAKTKAPQTVKSVLALLKRIIAYGVKQGLCDCPDPKRLSIDLPKVDNEKMESLTPDELVRLLGALDEETNIDVADMMRLALFTGMRRGELFKLQWDDVDFLQGFITLRDPKGGRDQKIPMSDPARQVLENHPHTESPYVFPGRGGRQRTDVRRMVDRVKQRAGLPEDFRPLHGLRHTYASLLASSGKVDLYTLQKLMTHKNPKMTQRYAHLADEALKRAAGVAGEIMNGIGAEKAPERKVVRIGGGK